MTNKLKISKALTLMELLITLILLSLIVLYFSAMEQIARNDLRLADRRAKVQNEASRALDQMAKELSRAIGNVNNRPVNISTTVIKAWVVDGNNNGDKDIPIITSDQYIAFTYSAGLRSITYCANYFTLPEWTVGFCWGATTTIAERITAFTPAYTWVPGVGNNRENFVTINLTACYNPPPGVPVNDGPCGTNKNPSVTMMTRIAMPSVSTN